MALGLAADIPAVITLALRTIHKIGFCYGFECTSESDKKFILGILSAAGSNSMKEKVASLMLIRSIEVSLLKQTWKAMAQKAAEQQLSKEGGIIAIKSLAKQMGINLTKRKALQAIPVIGAGVGASVNGWYIKEVGWAARRCFQERWLVENEKVDDI
ncbi:EcsC family protein [Myxococcota bacterium]|nr:EcsC family protein [Myxococcota bacterium]